MKNTQEKITKENKFGISIRKETRDELYKYKDRDETWDQLISEMLIIASQQKEKDQWEN